VANLQQLIPAIFTGPNGERLTPEQIAQRQEIAQSLIGRATDTSPDAGGWASVLTKGLLGYQSGAGRRAADEAIKTNAAESQASIASMLGSIGLGGGAGYSAPVASGASPTSAVATGTIPTNFNLGENQDAIRNGIIETAQAIGADPLDLATAISYETGGTFNPTKAGPTTQYGQHRGFIQFGEPQAKQHGVDWNNPIGSQLGANGAVANYFRSSGFKPGMSGLDLYSTINAGSPGRYNASDANNGGAPGSVADKWNNQMAGHRAKAQALLGGGSSPIQNMPYSPQAATGNPVKNMPYAPQQASGPALTPLAAIEQIAPVQDTEGLFAPGAQVSQADLEFARQATGPDVVSNNFNNRWNAGGNTPEQQPTQQYTPGQVVTGSDGQTYQNVEQLDGSYALSRYNPNANQPSASPELLAQNDMMLGGALSPSGSSPVAQALSGSFPAAPSMQTQQQGGINPAIVAALSNPYASQQERQIAGMLLGQQMEQAQAQQQQAQQMAQRQAAAGSLGIDPSLAGTDQDTWKALIEQATRNRNTVTVGNTVYDANTGQPIIQGAQERFTTITGPQAQQLGLDPNKAYNVGPDGKVSPIGENGVTVNVGGGEKLDEEFAKLDAKSLADVSTSGMQAQRNIARIGQLESLLQAAPNGFGALAAQRAGEWGINTEGLDSIQAAQAVINSLVPEQRPAGSGPMSDADLELFKQSLPRIINTPSGNQTIINTMRGIAQYDAEGANIVQRFRNGQLSRSKAFEELQNRPNPLAQFKAPSSSSEQPPASDGWRDAGNGVRIRPKGSN
jgi:hypothetical protein